MYRLSFFAALLATGSAAMAGDKPLYAPVPAWVKPAPPLAAIPAAADAPIFAILDNQQRLQDGEVTSYVDTATRAASSEILSAIGTIKLPWQPDKGDLTIHRAEIVRGAEHIDLLKGGEKFTVLHREEQLEEQQLNGVLTATMQVEDLRVGDVLHVTFSLTQKDPALKGNVQWFTPLATDPLRASFGRIRMIWPDKSDIHWKMFGQGAKPDVSDAQGYREVSLTLPLAKQPEMPDDAPLRYRRPPLFETTSFGDWASVSKVMAPLYATDGLIAPGSPLAAEVTKIAATEKDPLRRAELALELVQGKVRYLFKGMDGGNYVPQTPARTWSLRYGDCKAKTLLLLAILHAMDIAAEPVMANIGAGNLVADALPAPAAFNHVFVRATIGGETLWLDGTGSGAQLADIHDTPAFRTVLPIRVQGADLMPLAIKPLARPQIDIALDLDESAGINLPTPFRVTVTTRGQIAQQLRAAAPQLNKDGLTKLANSLTGNYLDGGVIVSRALTFDDAAGTATLTAAGIDYPGWSKEDERFRATLDKAVSSLTFDPDRTRTAWHDIPVATGDPGYYSIRTTVRLPAGGKGFTLDGDQTLPDPLFGVAIDRHVVTTSDTVSIDDKVQSIGAEIPAADVSAARDRLAKAKTHLLRIDAPADYPAPWQDIEAGKRAHRFDPALALYKQGIADQPDIADPFVNRAWFFERTYDWQSAIDDLTRAIAIDPAASTYVSRARMYVALGDQDKALADLLAAHKIDSSSSDAIEQLAQLREDRGEKDAALALLDERIDTGGKEKPDFLATKADILSQAGDKDAALSTIDAAITATPGNATLLNTRCWVKGTLNTALDTALKDCSKAIELSDSPQQALDSRAMVYFRLARFDDALADLDAALDADPSLDESLYMRGVIRKRMGDTKDAAIDLAGARLMSPQIDKRYAKYGILP